MYYYFVLRQIKAWTWKTCVFVSLISDLSWTHSRTQFMCFELTFASVLSFSSERIHFTWDNASKEKNLHVKSERNLSTFFSTYLKAMSRINCENENNNTDIKNFPGLLFQTWATLVGISCIHYCAGLESLLMTRPMTA